MSKSKKDVTVKRVCIKLYTYIYIYTRTTQELQFSLLYKEIGTSQEMCVCR